MTPIDRSAPSTPPLLSQRTYAVSIGIFFLLGIFFACVGALTIQTLDVIWAPVLIGIPCAFLAYELTVRSDRWQPSLAGHILMSFSVGITVAPLLFTPGAAIVRSTVLLVTLGIFAMTISAWIHPGSVRAFGTFLVGATVAIGLYRLLAYVGLIPVQSYDAGVVEYALTIVGCGYIDFYWTQALKREPTLDAAADSAAALFIDPIQRLLDRLDRTAQARRRLF